jgi:glycosyltransferase involved in cell wall biosynthesis
MTIAVDDAVYSLKDPKQGLPLQGFGGKISVVMPAYNEQFQISSAVHETRKVLEESDCDFEIIIVDDGSTDNTYIEASKMSSAFKEVQVIKCTSNGGKGNALRSGTNYACGDLIIFLDADLDLHPDQIHILYQYMKKCGSDVVIGSKRHPLSKLDYPLHRKIISNTYYILVKALFGLPVRDTQTGIKLFKQEVLEDVFPKVLARRYALDLELLAVAHHHGYKIAEAPIVLDFQKSGRIRPKDVVQVLMDTMAIFYRLYISKHYDRSREQQLSKGLDKHTC